MGYSEDSPAHGHETFLAISSSLVVTTLASDYSHLLVTSTITSVITSVITPPLTSNSVCACRCVADGCGWRPGWLLFLDSSVPSGCCQITSTGMIVLDTLTSTAVLVCVQVDGQISGSLRITTFNILRNEGVLAFYRGLIPTLLRSFPANGALFVTYEYTRTLLMPQTQTFKQSY